MRRERRHDYIWISNFFVTSVPCGLCPSIGNGRGLPIYGDATTPQVFRGTKMCLTLLLMYVSFFPKRICWGRGTTVDISSQPLMFTQ